MTYSIIARDPDSEEMGIATQSQALAVGSSVPWGEPGFGVIATQSVAEPFYGELGLDLLRGGLTAEEALSSLRSIDPHPERRQVAMLDSHGSIAAYTGDGCVPAAGHAFGEGCCALANMATGPAVWEEMVAAYEATEGMLAERLLAGLEAAEAAGGDVRGQRSSALLVVKFRRTGRPWQDRIVDLRVDDHPEAVAELRRLLASAHRYHRTVRALEQALDGDARDAAAGLHDADVDVDDHDLEMWRSIVLALAGRGDEAAAGFGHLGEVAPQFVEVARRMARVGLADLGPVLAAIDAAAPGQARSA